MSDEGSVDDCYAYIGFMFEGSEPTRLEQFEWVGADGKTVKVSVKAADNNPGALQSGHYLWAAAPALAEHLISSPHMYPEIVVELGAGCALPTLTALQIYSKSLQALIVTDHDPGCLQKATENYELNTKTLMKDDFVDQTRSIHFLQELLAWGDRDSVQALILKMQSTINTPENDKPLGVDLVLGSDLIYCSEVVKPLLVTVSLLLFNKKATGECILSQSFAYDIETELEIDAVCAEIGLERVVVVDSLKKSSKNGVKIQKIRWN